jgi:anthranilate phosphoribosyltransferase
MRGITTDELAGFRDALLDHCIRVDLSEFNTIDVCGTGGDEKNTFNISTLSAFVVAGAGQKVAKHGNYSVSSSCGSSNVLEYFGYNFTGKKDLLKKQIEKANICFMHAPLFNPAMKNVAPVRKELKLKTFFNMLGPMVNPAFPQNQLVGVFNLHVARLYNYIYQNTESNFCIIHALDGYDEISLTGQFKVYSRDGEDVFTPADLGFRQIKENEIFGGNSVKEAADIFINILKNKGNKAQNNVVTVNAAFALNCITGKPIEDCIELSKESIASGKAFKKFNNLIELSK